LPNASVSSLATGSRPCSCAVELVTPKLVVVTGGPGAGKTAVLELVRRSFCRHLIVLPEAASVLFGGGFPRLDSEPGRRSCQRAIFHVQTELQRIGTSEPRGGLVLCDRGTLDGLAYWPGDEASFFAEVGSTKARELASYAAVIHVRTPEPKSYNQDNPFRIESAEEAARIDAAIERAWHGHPRRYVVKSADGFMEKATRALDCIRAELPACCRALANSNPEAAG
jgi:predicted ATPase